MKFENIRQMEYSTVQSTYRIWNGEFIPLGIVNTYVYILRIHAAYTRWSIFLYMGY